MNQTLINIIFTVFVIYYFCKSKNKEDFTTDRRIELINDKLNEIKSTTATHEDIYKLAKLIYGAKMQQNSANWDNIRTMANRFFGTSLNTIVKNHNAFWTASDLT